MVHTIDVSWVEPREDPSNDHIAPIKGSPVDWSDILPDTLPVTSKKVTL